MIYAAAILIVASVALFVAAPLSAGSFRRRRSSIALTELERLEHERGLAMQGLRELEFDHEMGKLDDADYVELRSRLEARALAAMSSIEKLRAGPKAPPVQLTANRLRPTAATSSAKPDARQKKFCPQCGAGTSANFSFCGECGAPLNPEVRTGTNSN